MKTFKQFINENILDKMVDMPDDEIINKLNRMYPITRFFTALEYGYLDIAKKTKEENEHLIDVDRTDGLALEIAVKDNRLDIVKYLIDMGTDVNLQDGRIIKYIIHNNNIEMLKLFLDNGYNLRKKKDGIFNALHVAKRDGRKEMIDLIQQHLK